MKLTPLDIRHKEFRRSMRGYSDEEVDIFLDEVADEFERLFQENIDAQERILRLEQQVAQYEQIKDTLQATLITAQQQADEMRANARKEAELILKDSELKGRDLVGEAYTEKQRVQQSLIQLRQVEEDFRFKFRSLLEAHLNLLAEDEVSEDRRQFRGLVASVEQELEGGAPAGTPAASSTEVLPAEQTTPGWPEVVRTPAVTQTDTAVQSVQTASEDPVGQSGPGSQTESAARAGLVGVGALRADAAPFSGPAGRDGYDLPAAEPGGLSFDESLDEVGPGSGVKRFLFGRKDRDEVMPAQEPEDREFRW